MIFEFFKKRSVAPLSILHTENRDAKAKMVLKKVKKK